MAPLHSHPLLVAGLSTNIYNLPQATSSPLPVTVLIATHGRGSDQTTLAPLVEGIYQRFEELEKEGGRRRGRGRELVVVTLDQRNHGTRFISPTPNQGFRENPNHAVDMYSLYRGTTSDISNLIDVLPAFLFPNDEKVVEEWWVTGISLGGHAAYLSLTHEPRISLSIPIIGCPDYQTLLSRRIASHPPSSGQTTLSPPIYPTSLSNLITRTDPINSNYSSKNPGENPFWGKKILVLGGEKDKLVPPEIGFAFFEGLEMGEEGVKDMWIEEGAGHECTEGMIRRVGEFLWENGIGEGGGKGGGGKSRL